MKTDDYKQEFSISATLCRTKVKKKLPFKKIDSNRKKFGDFFRVAVKDRKSIGAPSCAEKKAPRLKGRLDRMTTLL